jgi:hypothetical protein
MKAATVHVNPSGQRNTPVANRIACLDRTQAMFLQISGPYLPQQLASNKHHAQLRRLNGAEREIMHYLFGIPANPGHWQCRTKVVR